jgi:NTP pyrophosphatase (non-canonical NTP hydrolase)
MTARMFDPITINAVQAAFISAQMKHGHAGTPAQRNMPHGERLAILVEEVGEVAHAMTYDGGDGDGEALVGELLQVAAMALAWVEGIEHRG